MKIVNSEQIKNNIEACVERECENCSYDEQTSCKETMLYEALAFINSQEQRIKELTEENEAWQKALISEEEKAGKAYYEVACEVENLRAKNERLHASCTELTQNLHECKVETVRKMQERFKERLRDTARQINGNNVIYLIGDSFIDQIAKEMLEGE